MTLLTRPTTRTTQTTWMMPQIRHLVETGVDVICTNLPDRAVAVSGKVAGAAP